MQEFSEQIYQQYLKAYKKGVFNYIKEDAQPDGQTVPRKYFSGGFAVKFAILVTMSQRSVTEGIPSRPTGKF